MQQPTEPLILTVSVYFTFTLRAARLFWPHSSVCHTAAAALAAVKLHNTTQHGKRAGGRTGAHTTLPIRARVSPMCAHSRAPTNDCLTDARLATQYKAHKLVGQNSASGRPATRACQPAARCVGSFCWRTRPAKAPHLLALS